MLRTVVFWGLYWGLPIVGNYRILALPLQLLAQLAARPQPRPITIIGGVVVLSPEVCTRADVVHFSG